MDPIREGIAQLADNISSSFNHAFQTFGILPDGRELIEVLKEGGGTVVSFPDRTDEGWPGLRLNIPAEAMFDQAHNALLGRRASWIVPLSSESVILHLTNRNPGFPEPHENGEAGVTFRLGGNAEVVVWEVRTQVTLLAMRQNREPESIKDAIRARSSALSERWREHESRS